MSNNNAAYIDPDNTWPTSGGTLDIYLYYKGN